MQLLYAIAIVYGNGGGRRPATCVYAIIVSWPAGGGRIIFMCAFAISAECAARRGNFEIAKQGYAHISAQEAYSQKQLYHIDQHKKWT